MEHEHHETSKNKRYGLSILVAITFLVGTITSYGIALQNWTFLYSDTKTHVIIARRVFDSITPGIAQLGGTWLPLQHVSMFPVAIVNDLWRTPFVSYVPNIIFLVLMTVFFYLLTWHATRNVWISILFGLLPLTNGNLLYMQALPMFEMPFLFLLTAGIFFSVKWIEDTRKVYFLVMAIIFSLLSLTRYEGWFVTACGVLAFYLTLVIQDRKQWKQYEGKVIMFCTLALFGIFLWLLWQLMLFKDPLYFLHSPYSAENNTREAIVSGKAITYRNIILSSLSVAIANVKNNTIVLNIFALLSILFGFVYAVRQQKLKKFFLYILWIGVFITPLIFDIYATYSGKVPIYVPELTDSDFNIRFGIYALPALFATIIIFVPFKKVLTVLGSIVVLSNIYFTMYLPPVTWTAAASEGNEKIKRSAQWIRDTYKDGKIMVTGTNIGVGMMFYSELPLNTFITDANGDYWEKALRNPSEYAEYLIATKSIAERQREFVILRIVNTPLIVDYREVYDDDNVTIYQRK